MAKQSVLVETRVEGLNNLLRTLRLLPKDAQKELRASSAVIGDRYMVPAWREAALGAGPWGQKLSESVRARKDRVPAVRIGADKKNYSGGASANMVRYPSSSGSAGDSFAPFQRTNWLAKARGGYHQDALNEWGRAIDHLVEKFNRG